MRKSLALSGGFFVLLLMGKDDFPQETHFLGVKMIRAVLFDLDGTLLPMDQDRFVKGYISSMAAYLLPYGYDPKALIRALTLGTEAMYKNDGSKSNEECFWDAFNQIFQRDCRKDMDIFEDYYRTGFQKVQEECGFLKEASAVIQAVKGKDLRPVLATNPLFPAIATHSRARWAGLDPEDFSHITTYENSHFCKPTAAYYQEILDVLGLSSDECLMVGNDADEDLAAMELGIPCFLLTDCLINRSGRDISNIPQGSFAQLMGFLERI